MAEVFDQREDLHAAGGFDQRPGDLDAARRAVPMAAWGREQGRDVVILRRDGVVLSSMTPDEAYRLAEQLASMADHLGRGR